MALGSTILRFKIDVSDVDRGFYEKLELRVARHPSESAPFLLTRLIAYVLNVQEGIAFTEGIANPDEAAVWVKDLTGLVSLWIDVGVPSAKRLHKASKASKQVRIYIHRDPQILRDEIKGQTVHRLEEIEFFQIDPKFLQQLEHTLDRDNVWKFLFNEGELSITVKDQTYEGTVTRCSM